jgi:hypothetical protein
MILCSSAKKVENSVARCSAEAASAGRLRGAIMFSWIASKCRASHRPDRKGERSISSSDRQDAPALRAGAFSINRQCPSGVFFIQGYGAARRLYD